MKMPQKREECILQRDSVCMSIRLSLFPAFPPLSPPLSGDDPGGGPRVRGAGRLARAAEAQLAQPRGGRAAAARGLAARRRAHEAGGHSPPAYGLRGSGERIAVCVGGLLWLKRSDMFPSFGNTFLLWCCFLVVRLHASVRPSCRRAWVLAVCCVALRCVALRCVTIRE